jgi:hypothetical protein
MLVGVQETAVMSGAVIAAPPIVIWNGGDAAPAESMTYI